MNDLDLKKIAESGQIFRAYAMGNGKWRFICRDRFADLPEGCDIARELEQQGKDGKETDFWKDFFDMGRDYAAVRAEASNFGDGFMIRACHAGEGIRILHQDPWEMLVSFIISQRKSIPAIRSCIEKLCRLCGTENEAFYAFPTPEQILSKTDDELARTGLGYRLDYVKDAAERVADGRLSTEALYSLSDEEMLRRLMEVKGVGNKVANCVMLFAYARTARVPVDTWVKKIIEEEYGGENPFPKYGENAGIMQQYAFFYKREITT